MSWCVPGPVCMRWICSRPYTAAVCLWPHYMHTRSPHECTPAQLELMVRFKKIAADRRIEGKGKKKREVVSVNGGGAHLCVDMCVGRTLPRTVYAFHECLCAPWALRVPP